MSTTALKALTATTGNRTDCWNTPVEFVGDVIKFFGGPVDLDPCSNDSDNRNVPAKNVYTEETNGLAHDWIADSVFMNHPYSNSKEWVPYAAHQYESGNAKEMVLLIKLDVSTKWWNAVAKYPWIAVNKRFDLVLLRVLHRFNLPSSIWVKIWTDSKRFSASMVRCTCQFNKCPIGSIAPTY